MRLTVFCLLGLLLTAETSAAAPGQKISLEARDLRGKPVSGLRFSYEKVKSQRTNSKGIAELNLPAKIGTGQKIEIQIDPKSRRDAAAYFLVSRQVNIPAHTESATVVLMRRSEFRQLAATARDAARSQWLARAS